MPSLLRWHVLHDHAVQACRAVHRVPAHALAESFSVLTRLPPPRALHPVLAEQALLRAFPGAPLLLSAEGYVEVIRGLARAALGGGRIYDAIVGATAVEAGYRLLTADRRALATYAIVGAEVVFID